MAHHDGLVHAVLRQQWGGSLSYAERLHAGRIGLWRALCGFDPTRGVAFSTYAWPAIQHEIWAAVRAARSDATGCSVGVPVPPPEPEVAALQHELQAALCALVGRLPERLRPVVIAYYGLAGAPPQSLRQLARALGCSHEAVRLRLWAALVWLRQPAHSLALRQLLDRNTAADYEHADALAARWLRRRGGRRAH